MRLSQNFSFWKTSDACQAALNLGEKPGRTLVRFDRFFQELVQNQPGFGTSSNMQKNHDQWLAFGKPQFEDAGTYVPQAQQTAGDKETR
jgi:hypothetical protein